MTLQAPSLGVKVDRFVRGGSPPPRYLGAVELGSEQGPFPSHRQIDPHALGRAAPT